MNKLLLAFTVFLLPAFGSIAKVQSTSVAGSAVTSVAVAFGSNNTAGNTIIIFVRCSTTSTTITPSDSAGNTYQSAVSATNATDGHKAQIFYAQNIAGGANTVTASFSNTNGNPWLAIYEYSGLTVSGVLDQSLGTSTGSASTSTVGPTGAITVPNELVFAGTAMPSAYNAGGTTAAGAGYTLGENLVGNTGAAGSTRGLVETKIVSAVGTQTATATIGTLSTQWSAAVATFKGVTTYYVANAGSDAADGITTGTPWQTVSKVNGKTFSPGDQILFNRGDTWREILSPPSSGSSGNLITFGNYGSGAFPIIDGSDLVTGTWTQLQGTVTTDNFDSGNVGWSVINGSQVLFQNGRVETTIPNASSAYRAQKALTSTTAGYITMDVTLVAGYTWTDGIDPFYQGFTNSSPDTLVAGIQMAKRSGHVYWAPVWNAGSGPLNEVSATEITTGVAHAIKVYFKTGTGNGIYRCWVDGVLIKELTNLSNSSLTVNEMRIGDNFNASALTATIYTDNVITLKDIPVWSIALTTQPKVVRFDTTLGTNSTSVPVEASPDLTWNWTSNVLSVASSTIPSTRFAAVDAGSRAQCLTISGKSYVTISGLALQSANSYGLLLNNATFDTIDGVTAQYNYLNGINNFGDASDNSNNFTISNSDLGWNGTSGIELHGGGGFGQLHDILISGNAIHDNGWQSVATNFTSGIKIWGGAGGAGNGSNLSYNATIQNNTVYNNSASATGIGTGAGIWVDEWGTGAVVRNNITHDNDASGIMLEHHSGTLAYQNIAYNDCKFWTAWPDIFLSRSGTNQVFNNVVYGTPVGIGVYGDGTDNAMVNNVVRNNIVLNASTRAFTAKSGGENAGAGSGNVYDHNSFGVARSNFIEWGTGVFKSTYAAFDSAYGSSTSSSTTSDPLFTNAAGHDFSLQEASPVRNTGIAISGFSFPYGAPDMGVFQYYAKQANSLAF